MKYFKILGLLVVAGAALMALVGTASAKLTESSGNPVEFNDAIVAKSEGTIELEGNAEVKCAHSTISGNVTADGGTNVSISSLSFTECGKDTVSVLSAGSLEILSSGAVAMYFGTITVQLHRTILGFPITTHCIYMTGGFPGTLHESPETGSTATLEMGWGGLTESSTDGACFSVPNWTGSYVITTPDYLAVD